MLCRIENVEKIQSVYKQNFESIASIVYKTYYMKIQIFAGHNWVGDT